MESQLVRRYVVVSFSEEYFQIVKEIPEASLATAAGTPGEKMIEGAEILFIASSKEQVEIVISGFDINKLKPNHAIIQIVEETGYCIICGDGKTEKELQIPYSECSHFYKIATFSRTWSISVDELSKAQNEHRL